MQILDVSGRRRGAQCCAGGLAMMLAVLACVLSPSGATAGESDAAIIAAGEDHTCALTEAGGVKCWGRNFSGQLGDGTTTDRLTPVNVLGLTSGVAAVATGGFHTCALLDSGLVKCWGNNFEGQLGDGTMTNRLTPVNVHGLTSGVTAVAAGDSFTCAVVTAAGGVKCWGDNFEGELGDGTTETRSIPANVHGLTSGVVALAAGVYHACALTAAGGVSGVKCWGYNLNGQLGDGTTTERLAPVNVKRLTSGITAIAAGYYHTCAVTEAGGVKCWGYNIAGQLGDGTTTDRLTPVNVKRLAGGVAAIAAGEDHTCALAGGVKCWGSNHYGQLGDGTGTDQLTPVNVKRLAGGVPAVAAGKNHTCAGTQAGGVKCWGYNGFGDLGDGTTTGRDTPVNVKRF